MLASTVVTECLSVAILAVPALMRWLQGCRLVRQIDDPAFPELRLAASHRLMLVVAVCITTGMLLGSRFFAAKLVLAIIALFVADLPSRRIIFGESWGPLGYLAHSMRFCVALFGTWMLLALTPVLVLAAGSFGLLTAILLASTSLLWVHLGGFLFPALLRASPFEDPELQPEFDRILELADCPRSAVVQAEAPGGYWINAFAIPGFHRSGVLFTKDLLQALSVAEIVGIFAHEVAHLEWFNRRRLLHRDLTVLLLSAIVSSAVLWAGPDSIVTQTLIWVWPLICIVPFVSAQSKQQALEHKSDLRALELTGDVEALCSGLTKIHHLLRLPRRWRDDLRESQSHPSLAARLRAIREAAGTTEDAGETASLPELVVRSVGSNGVGQAVVLTADRVHWLRGVPDGTPSDTRSLLEFAGDRRSIRYEDLVDLRLEVRGESGRHLVALDRDGTKLRTDLAPEDVAAVKERLQRIDVRLPGTQREVTSAMQGQSRRKWSGRIWGVFAALLGLMPPFSLPLLIAGSLVIWKPARATLAAAAAIGIGMLAVGYPVRSFDLGPLALPLAAETLLGFVFLFELIGRMRAKIEDPLTSFRRTTILFCLLAVFYLVGGVLRLGSPLPWMQFHQWARFGYGLTLTLFALAAVLLTLPPPVWRRVLALAPAMLAALLLLGGSLWFRDHFGDDPLGERTPPLFVEDARLDEVRNQVVDGYVTEVRVSPTGERVALRRVREAQGFEVELASGEMTVVEAVDLVFLDDERVARLREDGNGLLLETLRLGNPPEVRNAVSLPSLTLPKLLVDASGDSWEVSGTDVYHSGGTRLTGSFGNPDVRQAQWDVGEREDSYLTSMSMNAARSAVAVMGRIDYDGPAFLAAYLGPFGGYAPLSEIALIQEGELASVALTTMNVQCLRSAFGQTRFLCSTYDPEGVTRLWSIDGKTSRLEPIGTLPGVYHAAVPAGLGRLVLLGFDGDPLWFDDDDRRVLRLQTADAMESIGSEQEQIADALPQWFLGFNPAALSYGARYQAADVRGRFLAVASYRNGASEIAVHRLPDWGDVADPARQARLKN